MRFNIALGLLLAVGLATALPARAAGTLSASPASPHPTQAVAVAGTGFAANEEVDVALDGAAPQLATAGTDGAFATALTIPLATTPGPHTITAVGRGAHDNAQAAITVTTPWRQFGFDRWNHGVNPFETVLSPTTVRNLKAVWTRTVAEGEVGGGSTAAVVGSRVYVGTMAGVQALDRTTGAVVWRAMTSEDVLGTPLVANRVFAAANSGAVQALDAATGATVWSRTLSPGIFGSPALADGRLYIGTRDGKLYALQASTGAILWTYQTGYGIYGTAAVVDGIVYTGSGEGYVYALNAATGGLIWKSAVGGLITSSPVYANGMIYIGSNGLNLRALRATDGASMWSFKVGLYVVQTPAVADGTVFIGAFDTDFYPMMYALDARTGAVRWRVPVPGFTGSASVANGVVYVTFYGGELWAFDAASGAVLSRTRSGGTYLGAPAISDGVVYVNSFLPKMAVTALALRPAAAPAVRGR